MNKKRYINRLINSCLQIIKGVVIYITSPFLFDVEILTGMFY